MIPSAPVDVLLIDPPSRASSAPLWERAGARMPSLGLASIAAVLEAAGVLVAVLDCDAEGVRGDRLEAAIARAGRPSHVGITATTSTIGGALRAAVAARRAAPGARVVLGGVHPTVLPAEVLRDPAVDLVVRGEGEPAMLELVGGADPADVAGVSWRDRGRVVHNPDRPPLADLDALPLPAYHLFPLDRYRPGLGTARRFPALSMVATRGCPGRCTYCFRTFGDTLRLRSMDRILDDIEALQSRYGVRQIQFFDDTFTASRRRIREFCAGLRRRRIELSWACYARVDTVDAALLRQMADAGCHQVCYGIESGDPGVLQSIRKRISIPRVRAVVGWTRAAGIQARGTFMFGNPGETEASMAVTLETALSLDLDLALFNIATPYPGTELFRWAEQRGILRTRDWALYDRTHMVMRLPTVDPAAVEAALPRAWRRFYGRPRYLATRAPKLVPWRGLTDLVGSRITRRRFPRS